MIFVQSPALTSPSTTAAQLLHRLFVLLAPDTVRPARDKEEFFTFGKGLKLCLHHLLSSMMSTSKVSGFLTDYDSLNKSLSHSLHSSTKQSSITLVPSCRGELNQESRLRTVPLFLVSTLTVVIHSAADSSTTPLIPLLASPGRTGGGGTGFKNHGRRPG